MKKISLFSLTLLSIITLFSGNLSAQTNSAKEDFFVGKWAFVVKDLVNYDLNMSVELKKVEGECKGELSSPTFEIYGMELQGITIVDSTLSVNTEVIGFPTPLILTKKDENTITGSLMGFPFESTRSEQK